MTPNCNVTRPTTTNRKERARFSYLSLFIVRLLYYERPIRASGPRPGEQTSARNERNSRIGCWILRKLTICNFVVYKRNMYQSEVQKPIGFWLLIYWAPIYATDSRDL